MSDRTRHVLSPTESAEIAHRYTSGEQVVVIARSMGIGVNTIRRHLSAQGIGILPTRRNGGWNRIDAYPEDLVEQIRALLGRGASQPDIASLIGCSLGKVRKVIARHDLSSTVRIPTYAEADHFTWPRIWGRVRENDSGCWIFQGALTRDGYANMRLGPDKRNVKLHRWTYELMVAPIPAGLELDHLCFTEACINPYHCEPVPKAVNLARRRRVGRLPRTA